MVAGGGGKESVSILSTGYMWIPRTVLRGLVYRIGVNSKGCPAAAMAFGPPLVNKSIVYIVPLLILGLAMLN